MKKQLNEARGVLEDTRAKLAKAQDEINAKEAEVGGGKGLPAGATQRGAGVQCK